MKANKQTLRAENKMLKEQLALLRESPRPWQTWRPVCKTCKKETSPILIQGRTLDNSIVRWIFACSLCSGVIRVSDDNKPRAQSFTPYHLGCTCVTAAPMTMCRNCGGHLSSSGPGIKESPCCSRLDFEQLSRSL